MADVIPMPIATTVGATHVSVAQTLNAWAVMAWSRDAGPQMLGRPVSYAEAKDRAKAYADRTGAVLDLPEGFGLIHVNRRSDGQLEVLHESRTGESYSSLRTFGPHERDEAVRFALAALPQYQPCRLGEVAAWAS